MLDRDVNLHELAAMTKNYTGAEIEAVVKDAASYAMMKGNDIMDFSKGMKLQKNVTVNARDFKRSIAEVVPMFGLDQQNFEILSRNPLINFGPRYEKIQAVLKKT